MNNLDSLKNMLVELNDEDCYDIEGSGARVSIGIIGGVAIMAVGTIVFSCVVCNKFFTETDLLYAGNDLEMGTQYCPECGAELLKSEYEGVNPGC